MKIAIDISQVGFSGSGVARYTKNLITAILEKSNNHSFIFLYSSLRQPLNQKIKNEILAQHVLKEFVFPPSLLNVLWNSMHIMPIENLIGDVDVYLSSDWAQAPSKKAKNITVVHDMVCYTHPETLTQKTTYNVKNISIIPNIVQTQKKRLTWIKRECDHIIADSNNTKDDIVKYLNIPRDMITVIYPYVKVSRKNEAEINTILSKYNITKPFILSVGKLEPRKNIERLIQGFLKANVSNINLVIVGPKGWGNSRYEKHENIHFLDFVTDDELFCLYSSARFFIYPSLYEGFGYPIVEAMALGCPVATSNTSSLQEITQENGLLFNPFDSSLIAQSIAKLSHNDQLISKLHVHSLRRSHDFSQKIYIEKFMDIITSM